MLSFLTPYKLLLWTVGVLVFLISLIYGLNKFLNYERQIGYDKAVAEYTKKQLIAEQAAKLKETELNKQLQEARNAAAERDQKITELSNTLNTTSNSLLNTIGSLRNKLSKSSAETARREADTALSLLGECQKEYGEMAENADRHANDVKMLEDAWPK